MEAELLVAPQLQFDGSKVVQRAGRYGDTIMTELNGRYYEQSLRGNVYFAATQAAVTFSVGLTTTTAVGIILSNPAGSAKVLVPLQVGSVLTGTIVGVVGISAMPYSATAVTHTTALTARQSYGFGSGGSPVGAADSGATLPIAPVVVHPLLAALSTNTAVSGAPSLFDIGGSLVLAPGTALAVLGSTAMTALLSILWAELVP